MTNLSLKNSLATDLQIKNYPSKKDGIDLKLEEKLRIFACELCQSSGILLKL